MSVATDDHLHPIPLPAPASKALTAARIRRAQGDFRDAVVEFLGRPSTLTFGEMHRHALAYLEFERELLLPAARRSPVAEGVSEKLLEQHFALLQCLNAVAADTPGTEQLREDAHALRHALLAQVDLCEQSLCRGRPLRLEW